MNLDELERLLNKYCGYVADLEGSGVETFDLLFVRDRIQRALDEGTPADPVPSELYRRLRHLDDQLWRQRRTFLAVVGEREIRQAREQQGSPRSHWWWYVDELVGPTRRTAQVERFAIPVPAPASA